MCPSYSLRGPSGIDPIVHFLLTHPWLPSFSYVASLLPCRCFLGSSLKPLIYTSLSSALFLGKPETMLIQFNLSIPGVPKLGGHLDVPIGFFLQDFHIGTDRMLVSFCRRQGLELGSFARS